MKKKHPIDTVSLILEEVRRAGLKAGFSQLDTDIIDEFAGPCSHLMVTEILAGEVTVGEIEASMYPSAEDSIRGLGGPPGIPDLCRFFHLLDTKFEAVVTAARKIRGIHQARTQPAYEIAGALWHEVHLDKPLRVDDLTKSQLPFVYAWPGGRTLKELGMATRKDAERLLAQGAKLSVSAGLLRPKQIALLVGGHAKDFSKLVERCRFAKRVLISKGQKYFPDEVTTKFGATNGTFSESVRCNGDGCEHNDKRENAESRARKVLKKNPRSKVRKQPRRSRSLRH